MADFAIYWKDFAKESGYTGSPVEGWNTTRDWLLDRIRPNDRIWLFTAGCLCQRSPGCPGRYQPTQGYLAEIFYVEDVGATHIDGEIDRCFLVEPPLLIDSIIRQPKFSQSRHIGEIRQTPWELSDGDVTLLRTVLSQYRPQTFQQVF